MKKWKSKCLHFPDFDIATCLTSILLGACQRFRMMRTFNFGTGEI